MTSSIRIVQMSDTHFLSEGDSPEGGGAYDTAAAFEAVLDHLGDHSDVDLVVGTGDIVDHGLPAQYENAADLFGRFQVPVNLCPGNHDSAAGFEANIGRPGLSTSRVVKIGNWAFLFVDSNAGLMTTDESGLHQDPPSRERLHNNGSLGRREAAWVRSMCESTTAEHVFVWVHHPPGSPLPMLDNPGYASEWSEALAGVEKVRGFGVGHSHVPDQYEFAGLPVFVAPSLKHNFSLDPQTWLPPGYRTYEFSTDGSVTSEVQLVDDERWPRRPFGRTLMSLFMGQVTHDELATIAKTRS